MFNIANHFRKTVQTNISGVNYIENIDIGYTYIYVKFLRYLAIYDINDQYRK